jgi:hypothetical protein
MSFNNPVGRVNFVQVSNTALKDTRLSLKAKGLLALMLTFREGWEYYMTQLESLSRDGREAHQSAMKELVEFRYVEKRTKNDPETGRLSGWHYSVTDQPEAHVAEVGKPVKGENRQTVNRQRVKPSDGKPATNNTNFNNTNFKKTREKDMSSDDDAFPDFSAPEIPAAQPAPQITAAPVQVQSVNPAGQEDSTEVKGFDKVPGAGGAHEPQEGVWEFVSDEEPTEAPAKPPVVILTPAVVIPEPQPTGKTKVWLPNPAFAPLLATYNAHRGELPGANMSSKSRDKKFDELVSLHGSVDAACLELEQATRFVATEPWWLQNSYGLNNLLIHVQAKAEAFREVQAKGGLAVQAQKHAGKAQNMAQATERELGNYAYVKDAIKGVFDD